MLNKKTTIARTGLSLLILLALAAPVTLAAEIDWRKHEGTTLNAIFLTAAYIDAWFRPMAKRFQKETGIRVKMVVLQAGQARKKQDIMLGGKDDTLDVIHLQMDNRGGKLTVAGHLEDLQPYLDDPSKTPAGYNYPQDWLGGCLNTAKVIKGQPLNNIVWSAQAQLLHIRTDLFKKYNVKVPTNLQELEAAAKKLTIDEDGDGKPEIYGFLSRGRDRLITASFATYLWNHGGSWFKTVNGKKVSNVNSKESVDAFMYYANLIRKYAPPAALNNRPPANAALFAAGKTAMLSELNYWIALSEDKRRSRVVGKTTTILVPRGPAGSHPNLPTMSFAIPKYSRKKDAAWMYIVWMTQQHIMQLGQNNSVPVCRRSVWLDKSFTPPTPGWGESARLAAEYGIAIAKPQAIAIGQMRDAAGEVMNVAVRTGDRAAVQAEADKQAAVMNALIEKTEVGMNFRGVRPADAKLMPESEQIVPIKADGLERLGR
ncbi:MAG: extracellular solute-binding protein [SAR324 cluster bacterium]|nr:extracellular solute-binding protein [SAR324 cluster bacterium]